MYSTIPNSKFGVCNCPDCKGVEVAGRKVAKTFMCLPSYSRMKALEQIEKAKKKGALRVDTGKVRNLGKTCDKDIAERSALIADIDREFSFYVRLKEADKYGYNFCYTSGRRLHYLKLQAGHYISRAHLATRWDIDNVKPQSSYDNCNLHGNLEVFKQKLEEETLGITETLYERSKEISKPTISELHQLLIHWREKTKLVKSKLI